MTKKIDQSGKILGLNLFSKAKFQLLEIFKKQLAGENSSAKALAKPLIVFTPNAEQFVLAQEDVQFKASLKQADILLPDGIGVVWASRLLAKPGVKQRLAGVDIAQSLLQLVKQQEQQVFILGGRNYQQAVTQANWPVAWTSGYAQVEQPTAQEEQRVRDQLSRIKPAVLFVAFGAPWQEQWVIEHQAFLAEVGVKIVMVIGGGFDLIFAKLRRAPKIWQKMGLEWLYRLFQEPWRWRRQLRLVKFVSLVLKEWLNPAR